MSRFFDLDATVHPALSTVATSLVQTQREYRCPQGVGRLLCAASGSCTLTQEEKQVHLQGARMVFLSDEASYRLTDPSSDFSLTRIDMTLEPGQLSRFSLSELLAAFPELRRFSRRPQQCIVFYDNFAMIMSSLQLIHAFSLLSAPERELQISLTLSFLLAAIATSSWDEDLIGEKYNKHVRAALQYIHENYMCAITTEDIAAASGVHIGHLHRIFPAETGYRIGEYLTKVRIEKAKSLLIRTDIPTLAVAHRVGVSTLQYFSRLFKQQVGMTPQTFRRSYNLTCSYDDVHLYATDYSAEGGKLP